MTIVIDSEFKALIPPLQAEEFAQLEANILADGCRDPLVVWGGTLVDGHNRHAICSKHGLHFDSIEIDFDDRSYAVEWIIKNQFGRRNLQPYQRGTLALKFKDTLEQRAKEKESIRKKITQTKPIVIENLKPDEAAIISVLGGYEKRAYASPDKVYFVVSGEKVKIGASCDVDSRVKDITKHVPDAYLIGSCDGGIDLEKAIHKSLEKYWINNEWFELSEFVVSVIKSFIKDADFSNIGKVNSTKTAADFFDISKSNLAKIQKIESLATPEIKAALATGEISINQAHKEIVNQEKREVRAELIQKQRDDIETGAVVMPVGVFEVVAIDPPWNYGREYDPESSRVANPYPEMSQAQLLELQPPFADDCVLFLWTTHQFIWDAKALMDKWGFTYKANVVWDKEKIGMGAWVRMQCEFCLVGIKGKPTWDNTTWRDIIRESRREHSRKPDAFYKMVEEVTVGRRLEYFSREQRQGWEVFGNDTTKF